MTAYRIGGNAVRVVRALDEHPCLNVLQIASCASLSVSEARSAAEQLRDQQILLEELERGEKVYRLDKKVLQRYVADLYTSTAA